MSRGAGRAAAAAVLVAGAVLAAGSPAAAGPAPWPTMRHDARNTGSSPIRGRYRGGRPWHVTTGKGIFSTPVVGADGTAYVGSADRTFSALAPGGRVRWRLRTGGIVDAAAALGGDGTVTFGSGDERLYHVRTRDHRILWRFRPTLPLPPTQAVRWWEGNVAVGPGGDLFAGNTGGGAYRIGPGGRERWARPAGNAVWTTPAFGPGGVSYWGSLDLSIFALDGAGRTRWSTSTLGFVVSSPALGRDGTLYVASFDDRLYALDAATGAVRWTFQTHDHVYASPALAEGRRGRTTAIFIASTDGSVYAVAPDGRQIWRYDTGDVVRSSPVLGRAPHGDGRILYVGGGDGRLYALDAGTGRRRWSFDTTPRDPALRDRNDLNASPALGRRGVLVAGEHGSVWHVPYDYCLHRSDRRCSRAPGQPFGATLTRILPVTAGGAVRPRGLPRPVAPATVLNARLLVRRHGKTVDAAMLGRPGAAPLVTSEPPFPFSARLSGDGHLLYVVPRGMLRPGVRYRVRVHGRYAVDAVTPTGAKAPGPPAGRFAGTIAVPVARAGRGMPLRAGRRAVDALEIRRLAVPRPPFLTSVNQIGFDDYELIAGTLDSRPGHVLMYLITGRRTTGGRLVPDPGGGLTFPIAGRRRGDALELSRSDLTVRYEFGVTPQRYFTLRGRLRADGRMRPGASLYTEVDCRSNPTYGTALIAIGLCDRDDVLPASGTFLTRRYAAPGRANRRPAGLRAGRVRLVRPSATAAGVVTARLRLAPGRHYPAARHVVSIALADRHGDPVALDALAGTRVRADARGDVRTVSLAIPPGTRLPAHLRAYVVTDVFPLAVRALG